MNLTEGKGLTLIVLSIQKLSNVEEAKLMKGKFSFLEFVF
jgi:hypothetical protein